MLHKQRYSSPHLTAVKGTSAGALPAAVLCNNTPHLVKAAVLKVRSNPSVFMVVCFIHRLKDDLIIHMNVTSGINVLGTEEKVFH